MASEPRHVAISADHSDLQIYGGPSLEPLPDPPADREWLQEFRALATGYWYPDGYRSEEWAPEIQAQAQSTEAVSAVRNGLLGHLSKSNRFLRDMVELPGAGPVVVDLARQLVRQERAQNLLIRAVLELFEAQPPEYVTRETS